jgi:hypothetical protein
VIVKSEARPKRAAKLTEGDSANCEGSKSNHEPGDGHRGAPAWQKDGCVQHAGVGRGVHRWKRDQAGQIKNPKPGYKMLKNEIKVVERIPSL